MPTPVILDTDLGTDVDDLWALALVLSHPDIDLLGVTTVTGDTQARARLAAKLLRLAGREEVPVFAGMSMPIGGTEPHGGPLTHTDLVRDDDAEFGATFGEAMGFILDTLNHAEAPVTIVGTGAWTNVAAVIERADAGQREHVGEIALMGGEVHLNMVESNVKHDPVAARMILESGLPVFDATWSVSRRLAFPMDEVSRLCEGFDSPFVRALHEATRMWWGDGMKAKPGPVCYDVIPVFWAAGERDSISCIGLDGIPVEADGTLTRGTLVCHPWRLADAPPVERTSPDRIAVTTDLDEQALRRRYVELVFGQVTTASERTGSTDW